MADAEAAALSKNAQRKAEKEAAKAAKKAEHKAAKAEVSTWWGPRSWSRRREQTRRRLRLSRRRWASVRRVHAHQQDISKGNYGDNPLNQSQARPGASSPAAAHVQAACTFPSPTSPRSLSPSRSSCAPASTPPAPVCALVRAAHRSLQAGLPPAALPPALRAGHCGRPGCQQGDGEVCVQVRCARMRV